MSTAVLLLCALSTATALPNGVQVHPRPGVPMQPRFPQFKLPAFGDLVVRSSVACSKTTLTTTLAPGASADFQSPNYPDDYKPKSTCKWKFTSTTKITITCDDFLLQSATKKGKCSDRLTLDGKQFCGSSLTTYSGGKSVNVVFKSNKKKNYGGFYCTAIAEPGTGVTTTKPVTTKKPVTTTKPVVTTAPVTTAPGKCKCGQVNRATRIVGGKETEVNEYPWMAAMVFKGSTSVMCGGSVIGTKHVLTAAHCTQAVKDYSITYQVMVGAHSLKTAAKTQQIIDATKYIQHASYNKDTLDNDIAIIVLSKALDFTKSAIRPICLPTSASNTYDSVTATVSGWGKIKFQGTSPTVLLEVDVPTMSNTKCRTYYTDGSITDNMICAGVEAGGKDSCQGDSGGPLSTKVGSSYTQIGVVSHGHECGKAKYPGVYARVTKYLSWIATNSASSTKCSAA